ncbi:MAG: AbrB family DNA-binding protein [Acidilobaceae archaeon]
MAKLSEIVKVDPKGRLTIPQSVREALGIEPGMHIVMVADLEKREIELTPLSAPPEKLYEIELRLLDKPGALAAVADVLARVNADQLITRCTTIVRGEEAECTMVVDFSKSTVTPEDLRTYLNALESVIQVRIRKMV